MIVAYPLDEIWPVVLPRITAIRKRFGEFCYWTEEEVFKACQDAKAFLFNSDEDDSFAVVKIITRCNQQVLFVWIAYGENGKREQNIEFLREIAQSVGTSRLEWESPRRGFDRMPGVRRGMTTYTMEV